MRWKPFLTSIGIIALLCFTFFHPSFRPIWETVDIAIFKFLNGTLRGNKFLQYFWATLNHKKMDLVEDVIFLLFFIWGVVSAPKEERWKKTVQFICIIALATTVIHFVNRTYLKYHNPFPRESPSLVVTPCVRISEEIPWKYVKDETIASFPGDHATTLLLFGILFTAYVPKPLARIAWIYIILRILPRMVLGAHWFSDIAVGSLSIALFFTSCFLYSPLYKLSLWQKKHRMSSSPTYPEK